MIDQRLRPDILDCLANLSSDEVFTPPKLASEMLDLLPKSLWANPKARFIDPFTKSGVFLREIVKRLDAGLAKQIPDKDKRIRHILGKQVFGIAITHLTAHFSRRTLYCNKEATNPLAAASDLFGDKGGNILFKPCFHKWVGESCSICGASKKAWGTNRSTEVENYAYPFLHDEEILKMATDLGFDVVIGNPPYQMKDGGNGVSAAPIFNMFVEQAKKLNPKYLVMIIPARWYAGGKGLDEFRQSMLTDHRVRTIVDYESSKDCFEGVNIAGGVCYFLWDRDWNGKCKVLNVNATQLTEIERSLDEYSIFIRSNMAVSIVRKVLAFGIKPYSEIAYARNPFGFATNFRGRKEKQKGDIEIVTSVGIQYVKKSDVIKNADIINHWKILIGRLVPSNGELDVNPKNGYRVLTDTRIIGPGTINTETYLDIGVFRTQQEALNFDGFLKSKFVRFLVRQAISSLNVTRESFRFVPMQDFSKPWTDKELYNKYKLTQSEIDFIETMIRPMEDK